MSKSATPTIYEQLVQTTRIYLGPAAERFIDRQVKNHLNKEPEDITSADLDQLIDWIRISVSFLTEDNQLIEEYVYQLSQLAAKKEGR